MLLIGIFSALGLLLLALKAGGRKTIGHDIFVDILITFTLMVAFYGTFSGMASAMVGGLVASIVLFVLKKTVVHQKLKFKTREVKVFNFVLKRPSAEWEEQQPDWRS
jgi:phosphate/sulfate permease